MNTNGNTYTIVYSTIIVVLVAAILAFASSALKPMQDANIKAETISQMLDAAGIQAKDTPTTNEQILDKYAETVTEAFVIDLDGKKIKDLSIDRKNLELQDDLKAQNTNIKNGKDALLPVYKFNNGTLPLQELTSIMQARPPVLVQRSKTIPNSARNSRAKSLILPDWRILSISQRALP